jgi:hypothetical protein
MSEIVDNSCQPDYCSFRVGLSSTSSDEGMPQYDFLSSMDDSSSLDAIEGSDDEYEDSEWGGSDGEFEEWLADATHEGASVPGPDSKDEVLSSKQEVMGVDCIRFKSSLNAGREGVPRAARLVVVSADIVSGPEFSGYADRLLCAGLLQRIFIDECHTVIMDIGYWAKLGELIGLHRFGCPIELLTATRLKY